MEKTIAISICYRIVEQGKHGCVMPHTVDFPPYTAYIAVR